MMPRHAWTLAAALCLAGAVRAQAPDGAAPLPLWPAGAPGAVDTLTIDRPTITPYLAPAGRATGTAVVIFPGGGYQHLAVEKEGTAVARWLNDLGVSAFVVQYRLGQRYHHPAMLQDAQRAVRLVRARAASWGIDPTRVGVMGFSAGGHLASTVGTHYDAGTTASADSVERRSSRPDFMILVYPVITLTDPYVHRGSRSFLLGDSATSPSLVRLLSNELQVTRDSPPAFIVASSDDATVPVENSLVFYRALHESGVPVELHVYERGRHGFGLAAADPLLSSWPSLCATWLGHRGLLPAPR